MPTLSIDNHLKGKYREGEEDCKVFCWIDGVNFNIVDRPLLLEDRDCHASLREARNDKTFAVITRSEAILSFLSLLAWVMVFEMDRK
jgi:hypothetical protein